MRQIKIADNSEEYCYFKKFSGSDCNKCNLKKKKKASTRRQGYDPVNCQSETKPLRMMPRNNLWNLSLFCL